MRCSEFFIRVGDAMFLHPATDHMRCNRVPNLDLTENRARKRNLSDRILGSARIPGVEQGGLPDVVFLYVELFDFQIQRRPRNSEFGGGSIWPGNFSVAFRKSRFDEFLLIAVEGLCEKT